MEYKKTEWVNELTPVNAYHMNKIENALELIKNEVNSLVTGEQINASDIEDTYSRIYEFRDKLAEYRQRLIKLNTQVLNKIGEKGSQPIFTIMEDGCGIEFLDIVKPELDKRGIKVSLSVYADGVGATGKLNLEQLLDLQEQGHESLCNSKGKESLTAANAHALCSRGKQFMLDVGLNHYDAFVYPNGNDGADRATIENIVKQYFKYGINSSGGVMAAPYNHLNLSRMYTSVYRGLDNLEVKTAIDACISRNGWLILYAKSFEETEFDLAEYLKVLDYIQEKGGVFMPFSQAAKAKEPNY